MTHTKSPLTHPKNLSLLFERVLGVMYLFSVHPIYSMPKEFNTKWSLSVTIKAFTATGNANIKTFAVLCRAYCCSVLVLISLSSSTAEIEQAVTDNTVDDRGACFERCVRMYLVSVHTETLSLAGAVKRSCML